MELMLSAAPSTDNGQIILGRILCLHWCKADSLFSGLLYILPDFLRSRR